MGFGGSKSQRALHFYSASLDVPPETEEPVTNGFSAQLLDFCHRFAFSCTKRKKNGRFSSLPIKSNSQLMPNLHPFQKPQVMHWEKVIQGGPDVHMVSDAQPLLLTWTDKANYWHSRMK